METKICYTCGKKLQLESFSKATCNKDGLKGSCKECVTIRDRNYKNKNLKHIAENSKQYRKDNAKRLAEKSKAYSDKNAKHIAEYQSQYCKDNAEKLSQQHKQYRKDNVESIYKNRKEYRDNNVEKLKEVKREYYKNSIDVILAWRKNNIESITLKHKQYQKDNADKFKMYGERRRTLKKKLESTLIVKQWETIKESFGNSCCYCGKILPLAQDHFIALSKGGEYTNNNIVPSCKSCNSTKSAKDFFTWYPKFRHYSKKREKFILKYLNYDNGIQQLKII